VNPDDPPIDEGRLDGLAVVVTRPTGQGEGLATALRALGARVLHLPLLAIEPPRNPEPARAVLRALAGARLAIFVSTNAVAGAFALLGPGARLPAGLEVAAVGAATAAALRARGVVRLHLPREGFDSEALLALEDLQASAVAGQRVVIVRGEGGRELLGETLRARGARVEYAEVYRRARAPIGPQAVETLTAGAGVDALLLTSGEAATHLLEGLPAGARAALDRAVLVVPSARVAELVRRLGHPRPAVVARDATDPAMVAALGEWRAGRQPVPADGG
jgi:uroporphyrinogen-III synthase